MKNPDVKRYGLPKHRPIKKLEIPARCGALTSTPAASDAAGTIINHLIWLTNNSLTSNIRP